MEKKEDTIANGQENFSTFHSEEVQEIMGRQPSWILRWGITVIVLILLGVIVACWYIKCPQTITSAITLTSDNPPSDLAAKTAGILDTVYVENCDTVTRGQLIALIASAARYEDITSVEVLLDSALVRLPIMIPDDLLSSGMYRLGDLQQDWLNFVSTYTDFKDYQRIDQIGKKKNLLAGQVWREKEYIRKLEAQRKTIEREVDYEYSSLVRDSMLHARRAISDVEYETAQKAYITKRNALAGFDATMANAHLERLQMEQQILELSTQWTKEVSEYNRSLLQSGNQLLSRIALWKEQYAIIAPCDGMVSLQNVWSRGQRVNVGDIIASVAPNGGTTIKGRMKVPSSGFGKVREGMEVTIRLNGFPYLEFGILKGKVHSISTVPESTAGGVAYTVDVALTSGLESTYHKVFPFVQNMDGTAEIITDDMRLIERFIRPIRSLFVNQ